MDSCTPYKSRATAEEFFSTWNNVDTPLYGLKIKASKGVLFYDEIFQKHGQRGHYFIVDK